MKKLLYSFLIAVTVFSWLFTLSKNNRTEKQYMNYIENGQIYFHKGLYKDAIDNFENARKINDSEEIIHQIQNSLFLDQQYEKAFEYSLINKTEEAMDMQYKILQTLYENEEYKIVNKLLDISESDVRDKFMNVYFQQFDVLKNEFSKINYSPLDQDYFIADYYNKSSIVNNNAKIINSVDEGKILSVNYPYFTLIDGGQTLVYDFENNIRSIIDSNNVSPYQEGYMVMKKELYIDRTGQEKSDKYIKASNFNNGLALVKEDKVAIIDIKFDTIKELEADDFKIDERNNAIYFDTIILQTEKYQIYNIKENKYSEFYEDVDFNYGELIAVKRDEKWGYIDQNFNLVIDFVYDEAESFSCGIGLVYINGNQHMIDEKNNVLKELEYSILPFNKDGISFMLEEENYKMIKLLRFIND